MSKNGTKKQILEAVGHLLATKGFQGIGINAIAREAGVDKVLIYRYFENLPTLLQEFAGQEEFWPTTEQLLGTDIDKISRKDTGKLLNHLFITYLRELRKRPKTQAIMCWELIQQNELTDALSNTHEEQGMELLKLVPEELKDVPGVDVPAALALIHAGISYLILRSKTARTFAGIDLQSDKGWKRLEKGVRTLVLAFLEHSREKKSINK